MRLQSLSLRMRVNLLLVIALVAISGLTASALWSSQILQSMQLQQSENSRQAAAAIETKSRLHQLNTLAIGFLSDPKPADARVFFDRSRELTDQIRNELAATDEFSKDEFLTEVDKYITHMSMAFSDQTRLGLDHETGLEGQLRAAVHEIEHQLSLIGDADLQVKMLMMRRHEKDFMMRLEPKYVTRHADRADEFLTVLDSRSFNVEDAENLRNLLDRYEEGFRSWSDVRLDLLAALDDASKDFENVLTTITAYAAASEARATRLNDALEQTSLTIKMTVCAIFVALFVMIIGATFIIGRSISEPVAAIADEMLELLKARSTTVLDHEQGSQNEISHLQSTLAFFTDQLAESDRLHEEVKFHRDNLAGEVAKRTSELEQKSILLEQALAQEKEMNEMQTQFVSTVSHEFRTPLTIIDATARRLLKKSDELSQDEVKKRVDSIRAAVQRLSGLVETTLNSSKLAKGALECQLEATDMKAIVCDVVDRHSEIAEAFEFNIKTDDAPDTILADPRLLDHVVANVVSNAIKYSAGRPIVNLSLSTDGSDIVLRVKDHGIGIPKSELSKIGNRFFRATTSMGVSGTGIGLNLAKQIVDMHHGSMSFDSEVGEWTEVAVRLPIHGPCSAEEDAYQTDAA